MRRNRKLAVVAIAAFAFAAGGCGNNSGSAEQGTRDATYTSENTQAPESAATETTTAPMSDAPPEVNQAVLDYGRNIYRNLAQTDPTFTGPRDVDAAYCNRAGDNAYGEPLYECYFTYDGGTKQTPVRTWSWQGNAGAIPEDGDWAQ